MEPHRGQIITAQAKTMAEGALQSLPGGTQLWL